MRIHPIFKAEITIVGGGPAGASCAIALSRAGVKCVLVERDPSPRKKPGEIVASKITNPLGEIGLRESFERRGYLRSAGTTSLWGGEAVESTSAIDPYGGGYLIDRADFEQMLLSAAEAAGAVVLTGSAIRSAYRHSGVWKLALDGKGIEIQSPVLIEAFGRGRSIASAGDRRRIDSLVALLAYPDTTGQTPDLRFFIEAAKTGWWYASNLPGKKSVVAFLTDADLLPRGSVNRKEFFLSGVNKTQIIGNSFGTGISNIELRTAPAYSSIRNSICGEGWVCLGEAAASYDPLTGNGIYAAIVKGTALARLIVSDRSIGRAFREYALTEQTAFDDYMLQRRDTYRQVDHWPESVFWKRRRQISM